MPNYKAQCGYLVYTIIHVLTLMDSDNLLEWDKIKKILQQSLKDIKGQVIDEVWESAEEPEIDENPQNS